MVVSMAVAYVPESWTLSSFTKTAFVLDNLKDPQGIISLTQLHKEAKFYPDIYFADHTKHITLAHLDNIRMCGVAENFAAGVLHWQPKDFYKGSHPESKAPLVYQNTPSSELVNIAGSTYKAWRSGSSSAECHEVMVASVHVVLTFQTEYWDYCSIEIIVLGCANHVSTLTGFPG